MSRFGVEKFLYRFDKDAAMQAAWQDRKAEAFDGFDLSDEERKVLAEGDLATLYEWGFHPLLIRNFSGTIGVRYVEAYQQRGLKP